MEWTGNLEGGGDLVRFLRLLSISAPRLTSKNQKWKEGQSYFLLLVNACSNLFSLPVIRGRTMATLGVLGMPP